MNAPLENLQALLREDKVIPVIGAGVSYAAANLPGWKAAIENGLQFAEMHRLDSDQIHAAREQLNSGNLVEGADIMKSLLGAPGHPFSNWLKDLFGKPVVRSSDLLDSIEDLCAPNLFAGKRNAAFLAFPSPHGLLSTHAMIRTLLLLLVGTLFLPAASGAEGGLTPEILESLWQSYERDDVRFNAHRRQFHRLAAK
jgi:hypothetical protein